MGGQATAIALAGFALTIAAAPTAATAQTVVKEVVVSVGGEATRNPYFEQVDQGTSVAATAEIRPRLSYDTSVTRFDLEAFARGSAYVEKYGLEDDYGVSGRVRHRASERATLTANAGISSLDSPASALWSRVDPGAIPGAPVLPGLPIDDVTVIGQRGRTTTISAGAGVDYVISPRDQIGISGNYQNMTMSHAGATDYQTLGASGRYDRVLSQYVTVGLIANYRSFNYDDVTSPDGESMSLMGSFSLKIAEGWSLQGAAGLERTETKAAGLMPARSNTGYSGNASVCRRDLRETFCLDYSRQSQPTGYAGIRRSDMVSFAYSYRASEYDSITLGATYSRDSDDGAIGSLIPATTLIGVRGGYERRFSPRLVGYVDASVDDLRRTGASYDARARVGAGIRYIFGRTG